jgi:hypothetical protein
LGETVNDTTADANLKSYCAERALHCRIEQTSLKMWLDRVISLRRMALGLATLSSAFAAVAILIRPAFLGEDWQSVAAYCSILSAALTGLYLLKRPEAHQAECERLIGAYTRLERSFRALLHPSDVDVAQKARDLNAELVAARESAKASPPEAFRERAERELRGAVPTVPAQSHTLSGAPSAV